jgi:hypothetical protein
MGWMMKKKMLTAPSGTIMMPNNTTAQGMVRQRLRSPRNPAKISTM